MTQNSLKMLSSPSGSVENAGAKRPCPESLKLKQHEGGVSCGAATPSYTVGGLQAPFGVVGLSHKTAPLELLSILGLTKDQLPDFLAKSKAAGLSECIVLSTCNRVEVYYAGGDANLAIKLLAEHAGVSLETLKPHLYIQACFCAACQLFRVTSGLNSAVLGETEIVAQVKEARLLAEKEGLVGPMLDLLFKRAMEASKRIRSETNLNRSAVSIGSLAVREVSCTETMTVAMLGAGKMAARLAKDIAPIPRAKTLVLNRTVESAGAIAKSLDAEVRSLEQLPATLEESDVVFAAVGAGRSVINPEMLEAAMAGRASRPLTIVDLGVPTNVAPGTLPANVKVIGLEELSAKSAANAETRNDSVGLSLRILDEELHRFGEALIERAASPTIQALMKFGESVAKKNLEWAKEKLPDLDEKELRTIEDMMRRTVLGMLEAPINTLKTDAAWAERRHLLENLFAIGGGE